MESVLAVEGSLNDLETILAPLFETGLSETEAKLDTLQKAKLQVLLPYVVHNLVFSYLRLKDADASKHGVNSELERMVQYFSKIKNAESPEKRTLVVDQEAATRFIKHAIKEAVSGDGQGTHLRFSTTEASTSTAATVTETKTATTQTTTQATVIGAEPTPAALAKIEERKKASAIDDLRPSDDELMVIDDNSSSSKSEGKRKAREEHNTDPKKRRKGMDPWAGFDDSTTPGKSQPVASTPVPQNSTTNAVPSTSQEGASSTNKYTKPRKPRTKKRQQRKDIEVIDVDAASGPVEESSQPMQPKLQPTATVPAESSGSVTSGQNKAKKKRKKASKDVHSPIIISSDSAS